MSDQCQGLASVPAEDRVQCPNRGFRKQASVRPQQSFVLLNQRQNLGGLYGAHQRTGQDQIQRSHSICQRAEMPKQGLASFGSERPGFVGQCLGDLGVGIAMANQENLQSTPDPSQREEIRNGSPVYCKLMADWEILRPGGGVGLALALTVLGSACRESSPPASSVAPGARSSKPGEEAPGSPGHFAVSGAKLDAFLRYRRERLKARSEPAGNRSPAGDSRLLDDAIAEEAARQSAGLSLAEVETIQEIVQRVIGKQVLARELLQPGLDNPGMGDSGSRLAALDEERARFGEASVALVLQREEELTALWNADLTRLAR